MHFRPRYIVDRSAYTIPDFDEEYQKKIRSYPHSQKAKKFFSCSTARLKALLIQFFPIIGWLPKYNIKKSLIFDIISGISAGTIQVPQGMAFALLASLPPVNGLYSSFFPLLVYFFLGSIHHMVPGTFAVLSIIVGTVVQNEAPLEKFQHFNETLNETITDNAAMNAYRMRIAGTVTCLTAVIQICLGFVQFGFISIYLSESFIRGFMTAAGLQILISLLKYIFGLTIHAYSGPLAIIYTFIDICKNLPKTNVAALIFAIITGVLLFIVKEINVRFKHKLPIPIPMETILVIVTTAISGGARLPQKFGIDVVGEIPLGLPPPEAPLVNLWGDMIGPAFSLAIVGYVINLAVGRTISARHSYIVNANQEMLALGLGNFFGSFFHIHVICCALSVTLAIEAGGGSSQFASLCVATVVLVILLVLGTYLEPLPKAVLGALIAVNLKNTLMQVTDPYYLWKKSKLDCCVWIVSFLSAFLLGLPYGVAVGVGFSALVVVFQTQFRNGHLVAQIGASDIYRNPKVYEKAKEISGIKIITYCSPLYFANVEFFRKKVIKKSGFDPVKVLLAKKKYLRAVKKEEREADTRRPSNLGNKQVSLQELVKEVEAETPMDCNNNSVDEAPRISYITVNTPNGLHEGTPKSPAEPENVEDPIKLAHPIIDIHTLILDMSGVCFVDLMGIKVLGKMCSNYKKIGVTIYLTGIRDQVYEDIESGGMFDEGGLERNCLFLSVHDAVLYTLAKMSENKQDAAKEKVSDAAAVYINDDMSSEENDDDEDLEQVMFGTMFDHSVGDHTIL
ncbi:solute carrier family 26 member 9-like [Stegostoma tigrinum]|uniref:solute carrier family 26 member 9-like n=1 Tax=Stegostoma tigrinum TaxID=3053191 RepID=UPI00286FD242|nr:solute carrier family 26 member 9-like [Stegostoma tigrinum]XP_059509339.1 solute carrier family 26 member 9-like [Stegostoma tigrinum]